MEKFSQRGGCSLLLDHHGALLVGGQLAEHPGGDSLDVLDLVVEQLHKYRDDGKSPDDGSVVALPGQDVQGPHGALHDLLHPHAVGVGAGGLVASPGESSHSLSVLEGSDQKMDQPGDGAVLPKRSVVGRAEGQVPDETNDGLDERPPAGRVHQSDDLREAALEPHSVLSQLALLVSGGQMSEGAD